MYVRAYSCVCAHVCMGMWRSAVCQVSSSIALSIIIIIVVVIWGHVCSVYVSVCAKVKTRRQHQVPSSIAVCFSFRREGLSMSLQFNVSATKAGQ